MVLLSDELKALKLYIEMEKMRFDNQFEYRIIVAENVSPHHLEIPQLILQPFVENAIWHGLVHEDRPNLLKISIEKRDRKTLCIIEDNGIGREEAHNRKRNHQFHKKSMGMAITQNRIELTRNLYQIETKVEIIDLKDENGSATGTRVVLSILAI
jgi:LytS/YehU family sensor histidine kinase